MSKTEKTEKDKKSFFKKVDSISSGAKIAYPHVINICRVMCIVAKKVKRSLDKA